MSVKQVLENNIFPNVLQQVAATVFPETHFSAVMLKIETCWNSVYNLNNLSLWFSVREREQLTGYKLAKRRSEWLAGRIAVKLATASLNHDTATTDYTQIEIDNRPGGRPFVKLHGQPYLYAKLDISISHSGAMAAALAADRYCGIDIQILNNTLIRVQDRFCSKPEEKLLLDFFGESFRKMPLNFLWTAKEALRKAFSYQVIPGFLQLKLRQIESDDMQCFIFCFSYEDQIIKVACSSSDDFGIALCLL